MPNHLEACCTRYSTQLLTTFMATSRWAIRCAGVPYHASAPAGPHCGQSRQGATKSMCYACPASDSFIMLKLLHPMSGILQSSGFPVGLLSDFNLAHVPNGSLASP